MNGPANLSINKKNNFILKFLVVAMGVVILAGALNFFGSGIKNAFYFISSPLQKTLWSAGSSSSDFLGSFLQAGRLKKDNQNLQNENQKLLSQLVFLQSQIGEDQARFTAALMAESNGYEITMAGVIGLDSQDMLTINKGSDSGILEGMPVVSGQNYLFGKIYKVYKNFSQVMLISNKNSVVDVSVSQEDMSLQKIFGIVKGNGDLSMHLDLVPIDQTLKEGDKIMTSSLEKIFPKNLLIGTVSKLEKNDQKSFQQAEIRPFFSLKAADNLFVITNYKR